MVKCSLNFKLKVALQVMDLYNEKTIAHEMSCRPVSRVVKLIVEKAKERLNTKESLLIHTDQDRHYQNRMY